MAPRRHVKDITKDKRKAAMINKSKKVKAERKRDWDVSDSERENADTPQASDEEHAHAAEAMDVDGGNRKRGRDDMEGGGDDGEEAGPSSRTRRGAGGSSTAKGGSGGGALGRVLSPAINGTKFHDGGWTTVSTRKIMIPPVTGSNPYKVFSDAIAAKTRHHVHSDWNLIDWNCMTKLHMYRDMDYILNNFEQWRPKHWAIEISGLKFYNVQTVGDNTTYTPDLTAAMCIAKRNRGEIPYTMFGQHYDATSKTLKTYWPKDPWEIGKMPAYGYTTTVYHDNADPMIPAIIERGHIDHYTSSDIFVDGGNFGQASWIDNWTTMKHVLDWPTAQISSKAELTATMQKKDHYTPFDPAASSTGDYRYDPFKDTATTYMQTHTTANRGTGDSTVNTKFNRDHQMEAMKSAASVQQLANDWASVKSNKIVPTKAHNESPVFVPSPYRSTVHRPRYCSSVVSKPPSQTLFRIMPQLVGNETFLNQVGTMQVKVILEFEGKRCTMPDGNISAQRYYQDSNKQNGWDWAANPSLHEFVYPETDGTDTVHVWGGKKYLY